jgi:hypothetical protein
MATAHKSQIDDSLPILNALAVTLGLTAALFLLLYWLMQPKVFENAGLAAYQPPPGTRLEPLPRVSDAPQMAALQEEKAAPVAAQESPTPEAVKPPKAEKRKVAKKQPTVRARREHPESPNRYAQQRERQEWPNRFAQQQGDFGFGWPRFGSW